MSTVRTLAGLWVLVTAGATAWLPGVGHGEAAIDAEPQYGKWLANIVASQKPASDCGKPLLVAPAQPLM